MNYSLNKSKILALGASLLFLIAFLQIDLGLTPHLRNGLFDFNIYHRYANILLSGNSPYDLRLTDGVSFNYPPSSILFFVPFALLPKLTGSLLFTGISIVLFVISAILLIKEYFNRKILIIFLLTLLLQNFPLKFTLVLGQVNLFVLSFLILSLYFDHKKSPILSGFLWGASSALKLTPLTLAVYFLLGKKFKSFWSGIITFLALNLITLYFNPESIYYLSTHLPALYSLSGTITNLYDQSLRVFFTRLGINQGSILSVVTTLFLLLVACGNYINSKSKIKNLTFFSQILILTTIGNSFAWQHHFVFTFPGFVAISERINKKRSIFLFTSALISAILIGYHISNHSNPPSTNPFFLSHTLIGSLILYWILLLS